MASLDEGNGDHRGEGEKRLHLVVRLELEAGAADPSDGGIIPAKSAASELLNSTTISTGVFARSGSIDVAPFKAFEASARIRSRTFKMQGTHIDRINGACPRRS